jgi:hypothetical protein
VWDVIRVHVVAVGQLAAVARSPRAVTTSNGGRRRPPRTAREVTQEVGVLMRTEIDSMRWCWSNAKQRISGPRAELNFEMLGRL